jgi:hypothetical protein
VIRLRASTPTIGSVGAQAGVEPSKRCASGTVVTPSEVCTSACTWRPAPALTCWAKNRRDPIVLSTQKNGEVALPPPAMVSDWLSPGSLTKNDSLPGVRVAFDRVQPT